MKHKIYVLCLECFDEGLISKAAGLAKEFSGDVHVLITNKDHEKKAFYYGADFVGVINNYEKIADDYAVAVWLAKKIKNEWKPEVILAPATIRLRGILPILAGFLKAGLTADCTDLQMLEERLIQIRPAFGNHLMAWIKTNSEIQMSTVRQGVFKAIGYEKEESEIQEYELSALSKVEEISYMPLENTCHLNRAGIILAGGMGIGSRQNFKFLEGIANKIGAGLGASRLAVDAGFAPYACQIGQTGITVHPQLYIAVGISGAVQHLAGMSGSETVIAINNDSKAPIFQYADYGIVGDWKEILTKLIED